MNNNTFNAKQLQKLNNPERLKWLPPGEIWKCLDLTDPKVLVDFGAGTGYLTSRLAAFAPQADIHALDIQTQMIDYLSDHMPDTVSPLLMEGDIIPLADSTVDALWSIAVYHELKDRDSFLKDVFRILKPGGKILVIDWEKEDPLLSMGPPLDQRIPVTRIIKELIGCGFSEIRSFQNFNSHVGICASKPL